MKSNAARVRQFHSVVGDSDPPIPTQPDTAVLSLRRALIEEESREVLEAFTHFQEAVSARDREVRFSELVHELVDMLYVTYGALAAFGVEADEAFREVHRANMEKVSGPKREDGKQLKPKDWQPANIPGVLAAQKQRG